MNKGILIPSNPPLETVALLTSGRIVIVILAGLFFGLALQLLSANLGIAIGLSVFNLRPNPEAPMESSKPSSDSSLKVMTIIGVAAGLAIMLSIDGVLFAACFLAVKLSQVTDPFLGGVLGLLIWSVYLILLTWLSTSTVGTVADTLLGFTSTGLRRLFTAVSQLFASESTPTDSDEQDTEVTETVKQQLLHALEEVDLDRVFEKSLERLTPQAEAWQTQLSSVLEEITTQYQGKGGMEPDQIIEFLQDRINVPQEGINQVSQQLSQLWQDMEDRTPQPDAIADLRQFLQTAAPSDLQTDTFSDKLGQLKTSDASQPWTALQNIDVNQLLRTALRRVDLSDWDVLRVWQLLQSTQHKFTGDSLPERPVNIIHLDIEDYLLNTPSWNLQPDIINVDFKEVLYDADADPNLVHQQLTSLSPDHLRSILQRREDLASDHQSDIAKSLEQVLQDILEQVQPSPEPDETQPQVLDQIQEKLESYLRYTSIKKLSPEGIEAKLHALIEEAQIRPQQLPELEMNVFQDVLNRRKGLKSKRRQQLLSTIQETWQQLLPDPELAVNAASTVQKRVSEMIADSLQGLDGETVTLEDLKPHLVQLLDRPTSGLTSLNQYVGQLDWIALAQDLQQDYDFSPQHLNSVLGWLQEEWQQVAKVPRRWARRSQRTSQDWQKQLQRYLKYQNRTALTKAESMEKDLQQILDEVTDWQPISKHQKKSSQSWPQQLTPPDPGDVVAALQKRRDLTTNEIDQIASQMTSTWQKLTDEAQHLQQQAQSSLDTVVTKIWETLSSVSISAPDPSDLQADLGKFLSLPAAELDQLGNNLRSLAQEAPTAILEDSSLQRIRDRISDLTQTTVDNLLSTREDLEETVANQLVARAETLQNQLLEQVDQVQTEVKEQATEIKKQTQIQADKVRQSAAIAAWWLFAITFTSGITSAISGFLAIRGLA